jgi:hypothetical protein
MLLEKDFEFRQIHSFERFNLKQVAYNCPEDLRIDAIVLKLAESGVEGFFLELTLLHLV